MGSRYFRPLPNRIRANKVPNRGSRLLRQVGRGGANRHYLSRKDQAFLLEEDNFPITRTTNDNKLIPNWEGPFRVVENVERGAYCLEQLDGKRIPRTWNSANLRLYYG
ncbi:hypothetical protein CR513_24730, partial [Mucuna pruriens]